ncbi:hypothetical protein TRAPUB_12822 [Trametes pubescens]|uniref:Uncharacterized protein n=1 Tax=Trametes pubescens TaxID=154538 RepID=A0A1M2VSS4_TRAPU|nr:hypothetical protein TRAPUB_12822 [Trametes pubescens]
MFAFHWAHMALVFYRPAPFAEAADTSLTRHWGSDPSQSLDSERVVWREEPCKRAASALARQ